jgi:hypothetical protein
MQLGERGGKLFRHRQIHRNRSWSRRKRSASARTAMPGYVYVSSVDSNNLYQKAKYLVPSVL